MANSALLARGHGYETGSRGRCEAFDPYDILANPLGGDKPEQRAKRVFPSPSGGPGTTYESHEIYLLASKEKSLGKRQFCVAVHHGRGRFIWKLPTCYNYSEETIAALLAMPERALYSLLYGIIAALDDTKQAAESDTARDWRRATLDKRVKVSRQPAKGRAFVWIEPERVEGESDEQHKFRCIFAKPSQVGR